MDDKDLLTEDLVKIAIELDARQSSSNLIYEEFHTMGWDELCNKIIDIIDKLRI